MKMIEVVTYSQYFIIKQSISTHPPSTHSSNAISKVTGSCWLPKFSAWQAYSVKPSFADGHGHSCRDWKEAISCRAGWRVGGLGCSSHCKHHVCTWAAWHFMQHEGWFLILHTWFDIGDIYSGSLLGSVNGMSVSTWVACTSAEHCRTTHTNTYIHTYIRTYIMYKNIICICIKWEAMIRLNTHNERTRHALREESTRLIFNSPRISQGTTRAQDGT